VKTLCETATGGDPRRNYTVGREVLEGRARPNDVDDRVGPSDLVQVYIVERDTMDRGLGFTQPLECVQRSLLHARLE
jgi:hypothetical protein